MSEAIASHDPVPGADFVIRVGLADHGMPDRAEQLWVRQISPNRFVLCSIPFFAYGMAPGDELETTSDFVVRSVVSRSGNQVMRVALVPDQADQLHDSIHEMLELLQLSHEWHRIGYVAIELVDEQIPEELLSLLRLHEKRGGLQFEMATSDVGD